MMSNTGNEYQDHVPERIGPYVILQVLSQNAYLAQDSGGRSVVLKAIEADCMLSGHLHPNVHDRLGRVRELAHGGVAHLYGVERADGRIFAIWEFMAGVPLTQYVQRLESPEAIARLAREVILTVEALHGLGIVHGRLHGSNIFIDDQSRVRLTHISSLLYDNPISDSQDLAAALGELAEKRGWGESPVGQLAKVADQSLSLAQLRARISAGPSALAIAATNFSDRRPRRRALGAAIVVAFAGAGAALLLSRLFFRVAADKPSPPEAPPSAFNNPR